MATRVPERADVADCDSRNLKNCEESGSVCKNQAKCGVRKHAETPEIIAMPLVPKAHIDVLSQKAMAGLLAYSSAAPPSQHRFQMSRQSVVVVQFQRKIQQRVLLPNLTAFPILKP